MTINTAGPDCAGVWEILLETQPSPATKLIEQGGLTEAFQILKTAFSLIFQYDIEMNKWSSIAVRMVRYSTMRMVKYSTMRMVKYSSKNGQYSTAKMVQCSSKNG
ncbi:hypothetical protein DPMN_166937 [Dreissena polymorpha]|uniref:Uncharacterized protein n=1 Tax=Dreissena polymorpha TaxID=45954 RepID=A0A9D4EZX8_DREPO|nr:hypothetical protein DPMN_166937 [Dreissena polymorpha]